MTFSNIGYPGAASCKGGGVVRAMRHFALWKKVEKSGKKGLTKGGGSAIICERFREGAAEKHRKEIWQILKKVLDKRKRLC